jgi:hypothetical protein
MGQQTSTNPMFIAAISAQESGFYEYPTAVANNNPFGMGSEIGRDSINYRFFPSIGAAGAAWVANFGPSLSSPSTVGDFTGQLIAAKYVGPATSKSKWARDISQLYDTLEDCK